MCYIFLDLNDMPSKHETNPFLDFLNKFPPMSVNNVPSNNNNISTYLFNDELNTFKPKTFVKDINFTEYKPERAGVIVKVVNKDNIYYCLGLDWRSNELTDFGGHVEYIFKPRSQKKLTTPFDPNAYEGAKREFYEESFNVFGTISEETWMNSEVIKSPETMTILVTLENIPVANIRAKFRAKVKALINRIKMFNGTKNEDGTTLLIRYPEMRDISILTSNEFHNIVLNKNNKFQEKYYRRITYGFFKKIEQKVLNRYKWAKVDDSDKFMYSRIQNLFREAYY